LRDLLFPKTRVLEGFPRQRCARKFLAE
jgi:hypothetical protein